MSDEKSNQPGGVNALLVVISAPSGGGKTTLCHQLLTARPEMTRAITCTTREPRKDEKDGEDYYFLDAGSFLKRVQAGNFLEHATVYGHSYGTLKSEVLGKLRLGKDVLLNVDVQGAAAIRKCAEEDPELKRALVTVFLTPPSLSVLEQRLRKRGTDATAGDPEAPRRGAAGDRPVEEFRLPADQPQRGGGPGRDRRPSWMRRRCGRGGRSRRSFSFYKS